MQNPIIMGTLDFSYIKELRNTKIMTLNQFKGFLLEVAAFLPLYDLGVRPLPLHNPFDRFYPYDQHLVVDLIFIYHGELYCAECKNLSMDSASKITSDWVEEEVLQRFDNVESVCSVDNRILILSYCTTPFLELNYHTLELGYQVDLDSIQYATIRLTELFSSLFTQKELTSSYIYQHGDSYRRRYKKLEYIQRKLLEKYTDGKELEN